MGRFIKATVLLFILTVSSKFIGFARETILVSTYGASMISDAYIISMKIPSALFAIIASSISTTFIPKFYEIEKIKGSKESLKFCNNLINITILISLIIAIISFIFAKPLVKLFAMDFTGDKLLLTIKFTKIMVFSILFIGVSDIITCWLQINEKYNIPVLIGFPYNIIIISTIIISSKLSVEILAFGSLIAILSKLLFQLPHAYKTGYRYKLYINLHDENIKSIIKLIVPVILGAGVSQINGIIDTTLASTLGDGIITVLNSATRLDEFATSLFITTIVSIIYPIFSKLSSFDDETFKDTIKKSLNIVIIIMIPVSIGAIVLADPIVSILFERGKFDSTATILTAQALRCYAIGMAANGITTILNRVFYSMSDTKTPMVNSIISILINIVLNLILIRFLAHRGLALATTIASIFRLLLSLRKLKIKLGDFSQKLISKTFFKVSLVSITMGFTVYVVDFIFKYSFDLNINFLVLGVEIFIGALTYLFFIIKMNVEEVNYIIEKLLGKLKSESRI